MRRLAIDIETSPNLADVWGLWNQNVGLNQLRESTRMLCFAAQFEDEPVQFWSEWEHGRYDMAYAAWALLDQADVLIHYNGRKFDRRHLNREMREQGHEPPSPYKQIDLLKEIKKEFSFPSYKLEYVAQAMGVGEKVKHEGHELWVKVMAGDPVARAQMQVYNCKDTELMFPLYYAVRPWIASPNAAIGAEVDACSSCGSADVRREGYANLLTGRYQRFQCRDCGTWSRSTKRSEGASLTRVVL